MKKLLSVILVAVLSFLGLVSLVKADEPSTTVSGSETAESTESETTVSKTVTFKVQDREDQVIKLTDENKLEKQPEVVVPEGKELKGWKVENAEDSTAAALPETFTENAVYVAVFGDKAPVVPSEPGTNPEKPKDPKEDQGSTSTDANDKKANKNSAALVAVPVIAIVVLGAAGAAFVVIKRRK